MEVTIEDEVNGVIIDTILSNFDGYEDSNLGAVTYLWSHRYAPVTNETEGLIHVDLSAYDNIVVSSAHFEFQVTTVIGGGHNIDLHKVKAGPWTEGIGTGAMGPANAGEPTFNNRAHPSTPWNVAGCRGSGTDYKSEAESTTFIGSLGAIICDISSVTVEEWIETNYGILITAPTCPANEYIEFASSNTFTKRPLFYMEYADYVPPEPFKAIRYMKQSDRNILNRRF